jgi:1-deoxy-D-xylulose-5-phosphate synthase
MTYVAMEVRRRVLATSGRLLSVINARFAKPLDEQLIGEELRKQPVVFTMEDHSIAGGFGSAVNEYASTLADDAKTVRVQVFALPDRFIDHGSQLEQLTDTGLDVGTLTERVLATLSGLSPLKPTLRMVSEEPAVSDVRRAGADGA